MPDEITAVARSVAPVLARGDGFWGEERMRYLFFANTPAQAHLYRNVVTKLRDRGHVALILARDYGCTVALLEWYDVPHVVYGACDTSKWSLFRNLPDHYLTSLRYVRQFGPDLLFGMGGYAAHTGFVTRTPTILVLDSEPTSLDHLVSKPFVDAILTPAAFQKNLGEKHFTFDGFKESAYLHPEEFTPNPAVRDRLGVGSDEKFVLLRLNAFGSHHDIGKGGFTKAQCRTLVEQISAEATVFVSDEGDKLDVATLPAREFDVHPALMHDALYEASLVVADTQTIVTEAALLGTPVVRSNSFVGEEDMGNFLELEDAGLVCNVSEFGQVQSIVEEILADSTARTRWRRRRDKYMEDKANLSEILVDVATSGTVRNIPGISPRVDGQPSPPKVGI